MLKLRLVFEKTGRARFLSHLDTMRIIQRALSRTQSPVSYSEGYNPHMHLSVVLPLSLGLGSVCELLDIRLDTDIDETAFLSALNAALPEGFRFTQVLRQLRAGTDIAWISYEIQFERMAGMSDDIALALQGCFDGRSLMIQKKTKHGIAPFDVAPYVKNVVVQSVTQHTLTCTAALSAQSPTVNPTHLLDALQVAMTAPPDVVLATRLALYDAEHCDFLQIV